jgi:hypothetical protein
MPMPDGLVAMQCASRSGGLVAMQNALRAVRYAAWDAMRGRFHTFDHGFCVGFVFDTS